MEQAKPDDRLQRTGLLSAAAPSLGVLLQTAVFLLVFRQALPTRVTAYLVVMAVSAVSSGVFLATCLPELANRSWAAKLLGRKSDRTWQILFAATTLLITPIVAAFELLTFQSAAFGEIGFLIGMLLQTGGFYLLHLAKLHNRCFINPIVIPGTETDAVCTTGPYRWLRHPGYLAMALISLAAPLLLGSLVALFPALAAALLLVYRTGEEDSFLLSQLPEYQTYRTKVKRRFLPGIW